MRLRSCRSSAGPEVNALAPELNARAEPALSGTRLIAAAIAVCAALQLQLAFTQPINWDEFRFLSDVYAHRRGDLASPVQSFHVHLFGWLAERWRSEIDQIIIGRFVMLALEWGTAALLFGLCRRYVDRTPALLAVLAFLTFSYVLKHGASFRYDPIATFLLMVAASLLMAPRLRWTNAVGAGGTFSLAALVTIKAALYLPLLAAIAAVRLIESDDRPSTLLRLAGAGMTAVGLFAGLYLLHSASLAGAGDGQAIAAASARKTLGGLLFPRLTEFARSVIANPFHWLLLGLGVAAVLRGASERRGFERPRALLPLAFLLPLASLLFYRNAFPYFFAFMLAPAFMLVAIAAGRSDVRRFVPLLAAAMVAGAAWQAFDVDRSVLGNQRRTLVAARDIFPEDTA